MFTVTVLPTEGAGNSRSWTIATLPTGTNDKRWLSLGRPVFQTIILAMVRFSVHSRFSSHALKIPT